YDGVSGSLAGLVVAAAGLALLPSAPGLVATAGMSLATAEYAASEVLRTSALGTGPVTIALGLAWVALALTRVLTFRGRRLVAGAVLVAASAIGLRLRRETTPAPPVRYP